MINVTVIRVKDIIKYIAKITFFIVITIGMTKFFINSKEEKERISLAKIFENIKNSIIKDSSYAYINDTMPVIEQINNENIGEIKKESQSTVKKLLLSELGMIENLGKVQETELQVKEDNEKTELQEQSTSNQNRPQISSNLQSGTDTEVIESGITPTYTNVSYGVEIKNESSYALTEEMMIPEMCISNKKDILIFHTHTCESYTPSAGYEYEASGSYRTTDLNLSVAGVGTALTDYLTGYNYNVIHDTTYHDYPAYSGSYNRSLETVNSILASNTGCEMVFDIHRDAIGSKSDYAPLVRIGEEYAAQLMFVIGTDGGGLEHSNWINNLKFAIAVQKVANQLYPGLFKPIIVRNSRYNQHVSNGAVIIEVGATGNTMEQCITSMKYLAKVVSEVVKD